MPTPVAPLDIRLDWCFVPERKGDPVRREPVFRIAA
jgi:hypothetical protein